MSRAQFILKRMDDRSLGKPTGLKNIWTLHFSDNELVHPR